MLIFLKNIKFYIFNHRYFFYTKLFAKNLINFNILKSTIFKTHIYSIGNFKAHLNPFIYEELLLIDNPKINDIDYIQSLRNFIDKKVDFYLYNVESNLLPLFLSKTLQSNVHVYNFKKKKIKEKNIKNYYKSNKFFLNTQLKNKKKKILITDTVNNLDLKKTNFKFIFSKKKIPFTSFYNYEYVYDIYGKIHLSEINVIKKYYIYTNHKLLNVKKENSITAISLLKSLDIYPFDICYESVLPFVKELILGIDSKSFNSRYEKILNKFLKQTKFKKKIKIKFFDFHTNTTSNCYIKARWIADVNNKLTNEISSKYLCYVQADEIFEYSLKKDFRNILRNNSDELNINFLHFIYDFNHIRDPRYAAYNNMGRVYKKFLFTSTHDGCGFRKTNDKRSNINYSKRNIFHIGYIYNFKKKILKNLSKKDGIFRSTKANFYRNLNLVKVNKQDKIQLINTINRYKYLDGYKNLKKFI
tara:strand:+ start:7158 stop:8570 length:1413 start_codon:yes stop_codon:yes gene_type:complete